MAVVSAVLGTQAWLHRRRRLAFVDAAARAGLDPGDGPWVEAKCAAAVIVGREVYHRSSRDNPIKETSIVARLPGKFPEAFHASTDEHAIGIVRESFPTASGRGTVYVRGLIAEETRAFLGDPLREAMAEAFDLGPDLVIEPNEIRLFALQWFSPEYLRSTFAGIARLCRVLAPDEQAYRG